MQTKFNLKNGVLNINDLNNNKIIDIMINSLIAQKVINNINKRLNELEQQLMNINSVLISLNDTDEKLRNELMIKYNSLNKEFKEKHKELITVQLKS